MDSDAASLFDGLSTIPLSFLEVPRGTDSASESATGSMALNNEIDLFSLPNLLADLEKPLPIISAERPPMPPLAGMPPLNISPLDLSSPMNVSSHHDNDEDSVDDSLDDSSLPTGSPNHVVGKEAISDITVTKSVTDNMEKHEDRDKDTNVTSKSTGTIKPSSPTCSTPPVRGNVSHTRRCRAKVNNNFDRLLDVLPEPAEGVEVKHKAQILAYAIERFQVMRCHNVELEMQLALSSPHQMHRWVRSVASSAKSLSEALKPFMAMICLTKKWKYAELWKPTVGATSGRTSLKYVTGALPPSVQGDELNRLRRYRTNSRRYVFRPRSGVPGRVFLTMRPEWLPLLNDPIAFPRAPHAVHNKVEVTFAVPVVVNGSVQMVVQFYDLDRREYEVDSLNTANQIAELFGKAYTGSTV